MRMKTIEQYLLDAAEELNRIMFRKVYGDFPMPSKSAKQHRYMEAIAHGMKPRSKNAPSKKVAREFVAADKRKRKK